MIGYFVAVTLFLSVGLVFGNIDKEGIRSILNQLIVIDAAILAITFAAVSLNPSIQNRVGRHMFAVSLISSFAIFGCLFTYILSYMVWFQMMTTTILFSFCTFFTIASVVWVLIIIYEYIQIATGANSETSNH